ncbi:MAG: GumN family protein [Caulobacteraceae bacterium]|nr:GumN family protein [Caulobacteraceae bacterium]
MLLNSRSILALALAALIGGSVHATEAPAPDPAAASDLVAELVVRARTPGPAWWKVSDADTTVWVLGAPEVLPAKLKWTQTPLRARLRGANALILPAREKVGLIDIVKLILTFKDLIYGSDRLEERLPPALYARYQAVLARTPGDRGGPPQDQDMGDLKTAIFALMLDNRLDRPLNLKRDEPEATAIRIASDLKVHRVTVGTYDQMPIIREFLAMPEPMQQACLDRAIGKIEAGERVREKLAAAWAAGDVPTALARLPGEAFCATGPLAAAQDRQAITDTVAAISDALKRPGKAVAVVELTPLVTRNGVLDLLRAKGYKVVAPDVL